MNLVRWILGIFLAFGTFLAAIISLDYNDTFLLKNLNYNGYLAIHCLEVGFDCCLLVILSCLLVPSPKKYAAIISVVSIFLIAVAGLCLQYNEHTIRQITPIEICSYISFFVGGTIGIIVSNYRFRSKGWNAPVKEIKIEESY